MLVLCVAIVVSLFGMIIAVRQFVVSPYYIATDAFAPTYTKGQYVLVSYRQMHPTAGQYIMYYTVGEAAKDGYSRPCEKCLGIVALVDRK